MPELLEYNRPRVPEHHEIVLGMILGGGAGVLLTIVVVGRLLVGDLPESALIARVSLPFTMLGATLVPSAPWMYWPVLVSAIVQYPFYGAICGGALAKGQFWKALGVVAVTHAAGVAAAAFAYFS